MQLSNSDAVIVMQLIVMQLSNSDAVIELMQLSNSE